MVVMEVMEHNSTLQVLIMEAVAVVVLLLMLQGEE